jgi:hypothetical protein
MNQLIHPRYDCVKTRVRVAGFEPAVSRFRTGRISQAFPHPDRVIILRKCPAGVEPALPPWHGGRLPLHHGHMFAEAELSKRNERAPGGTRTHVAALRARHPGRWMTGASKQTIESGTRGARTLTTRLRAGRAATNTLVPSVNLNLNPQSAREESNLRLAIISRLFGR